jgi:hypothetical protein
MPRHWHDRLIVQNSVRGIRLTPPRFHPMNERLLLATSIAPHNVENQRRAVQSWIRLGFHVASLNTAAEIERLAPVFDGVEFVAAQRDASADCGKPLVYLDDVVAFLRSRTSPVVGLINSDIHLRSSPATVEFLLQQARNAIVLASRTDVGSIDDESGEVYKLGFDAFLFDRAILETLPSTEFCLGQPWWDYWLASRFIVSPQSRPSRFALKLVAFPFAVHVRHDKHWDRGGNYEKYGLHFAKHLDPGTYEALLKQPPETLRNSLHSMSVNVAATLLLQGQWISHIPK